MASRKQPINHVSRYHASQSYILPSDDLEAQRLNEQHNFVTKAFEDRIVLAPVELSDGTDVLDIGTGSGAWALDLAENYPGADKARILCVDIESRLFPKEHPPNTKFETASVLALPADWDNKFTFVHQRLLKLGLKRHEWATAINEIFRITAPGGWVQLCEANPVMISRSASSTKWWTILNKVTESHGLDLHCADRIGGLLEQAGFRDIRVEQRTFKLGRCGGDTGAELGNNLVCVWKGMKTPVLLSGGFGVVNNEAEFDALLTDIVEEWKLGIGAELEWHVFIGRKPPTSC